MIDTRRIVCAAKSALLHQARKRISSLEQDLFDTAYNERQRIEARNGALFELDTWYASIGSEVATQSDDDRLATYELLVDRYLGEISTRFDPLTYYLSTSMVPTVLGMLLSGAKTRTLVNAVLRGGKALERHVTVSGETDRLRALSERGTVVLLCSHQSHLDSLCLAFVLHHMGLPPFLVGAEPDLFDNPLVGFFVRRLGAFTMDATRKAPIYKDCLSHFISSAAMLGFPMFYFPAGRREDSGCVDLVLLPELLYPLIRAQLAATMPGSHGRDVFVFPCTVNYELVLEAESLIAGYLRETLGSRFIAIEDEFSRPRRVLDFLLKIATLDSKVIVHVGEPLDVLGNRVDEQGRALDARGRVVDRRKYFYTDGHVSPDPQRDYTYAKELAQALAKSFKKYSIMRPVHVVARAFFELMAERNQAMDLVRLIRTGGYTPHYEVRALERKTWDVLERLKRLAASRCLLQEGCLSVGRERVLETGIDHLGQYHVRSPIQMLDGNLVRSDNRAALLYYANRLSGYQGFGRIA